MVTTIEGIYENGQITLSEKPKVDDKVKVFVLFTEEKKQNKKPLVYGTLKGKIQMSDDFNDELEDFKDYK